MTLGIYEKYASFEASSPLSENDLPVRVSASLVASEARVFDNPAEAQAFVTQLYRLRVGAIAIDTEFQYQAAGVLLRGGRHWHDPTSLVPLVLTGAAWVPSENQAIRFLFDLRAPGMASVVEDLLRIHTVFVAHHFGAEWHCLWALGLDPVLHQTYDTHIAAKALLLGHGHPLIDLKQNAKSDGDWKAEEKAETQITSVLSLSGQCEAYQIPHRYGRAKGLLQRSFLDHEQGAPFGEEQVQYALADAEMTLNLYLAQQPDIIASGLASHLFTVEFPYVEANARMTWDGAAVDLDKVGDLARGLSNAVEQLRADLNDMGLTNPGSPPQVIQCLTDRGLGDRLVDRGKASANDRVLEKIEALDPAVPLIRKYRRYRGLLNGPILTGELVASDGRFHPNYKHLGADTGRSTSSAPNIMGLPRAFRPIITAPANRAILEADYSQIEVGIAAAEFGDVTLIDAFNSGDVYSAIAKEIFWDELSEDDRMLSLESFKSRHKERRDQAKIIVLGTIYGMQDQSIADRLGITLAVARSIKDSFRKRYPGLVVSSERAVRNGRLSGFAPIIGGMRRHVSAGHSAANKLVNTPIQAGAGVVFRKAVVDIFRAFRGTSRTLVLTVHDSVLVECDQHDVDAVAHEITQIMVNAVRSYYPQLQPRVDVNAQSTGCWNKDGEADSIGKFLDSTAVSSDRITADVDEQPCASEPDRLQTTVP